MTDIPHLKDTPLSTWIANAAPGERVIVQTYTHGANKEARQAMDAGLITLNTRRAEGHMFDLIATRLHHVPKAREIAAHRPPKTSRELMEERVQQSAKLAAQGFKYEEIAERLGVSRSAVCDYVRKAKEKGLLAKDRRA